MTNEPNEFSSKTVTAAGTSGTYTVYTGNNGNPPQIYGLIGKAMSKVGAIGKDSQAKNFSGKVMYNFRGIDAVYNAVNPIMAELGLFIIPEILEQNREERQSKEGSTLIYTILKVRFRIYAPDGSNVSGTTIGEAMDSGDKSSNKAMSAALKYFMFQTLMIPTEEMKDPDADVYEVAPRQRPVTPPAVIPASNPIGAPTNKVEKVPSVPALPQTITAKDILMNEIKFRAEQAGMEKPAMIAQFEQWRKSLVSGGVVKDIRTADMTVDQAKELVKAIRANFPMEDGK